MDDRTRLSFSQTAQATGRALSSTQQRRVLGLVCHVSGSGPSYLTDTEPDCLRGSFWGMKLDEAEERVRRGETAFTHDDIMLAADWQTCVCGMQDSRIPRHDRFDILGMPKDRRLSKPGARFASCLCEANDHDGAGAILLIDKARGLIRQIDAGAQEVLREMGC